MEQKQSNIVYPLTRRDNTIDKNKLPDPYRWLENSDSQETKQWVDDQNQITQSYLSQYPHREDLNKKLTDIYNYEKYGAPYKRGDNYYFSKNDGLQNQSVVYTLKNLDDKPEIFIDPNTLSSDGTIALDNSSFSEDGKLWAYSLCRGGSDWKTVYVKDVQTKKDLTDKLEFVKFCTFSWTKDNKGFFYTKYPQPKDVQTTESDKAGTETDSNQFQKQYYHRVGTQQQEDILIYENSDDPKEICDTCVSDDGKYIIIGLREGCSVNNKIYYADISGFSTGNYQVQLIKLIDNKESMYSYITNNDSVFYFLSNCDSASRNKVIQIDINSPQKENWKELIKETKDVIQDATALDNDKLLVIYNENVHDVMKIYKLETGEYLSEIPTPTVGSVSSPAIKRYQSEMFYVFTSFLYPASIYKYDFKTGESSLFRSPKLSGFNPDDYETKQVFYENKNDKEQIPMFIIQKKNSPQNQPMYLYGYGGFNISLTPGFSPFRIILMKCLNVGIAIANIRGGGEYGEEWHQKGTKERKQNVFDDFCFAAEYLIDNNYTSGNKLAIAGGSNGGLLVGACINQRPELFKVGISQVGVLDMLRFHLFTIGHAWCSDYGNPDNEEDFKYLIKYSPIHNVNTHKKPYPAVLLTTGSHDDRVVPLHSYKYIATLQHELRNAEYQKDPLLIRIETKAGHGMGKPTAKIIEEITDIYTFMAQNMGLEWSE